MISFSNFIEAFFHSSDSDLPKKTPVSTRLKPHNLNIFIFLITALPDELLSVVFKYLVLKRLKRLVSESDMLWSTVCLDEWGISYLSHKEHLETIMKHTRGFRYFLVAYIGVKQNPFKEPQATAHTIFNNSVLFVSWT